MNGRGPTPAGAHDHAGGAGAGEGSGPQGSPGNGLVDWDVARRSAQWLSARNVPPASYHRDALQADFDEAVERAEALVAEATGLRPTTGPARAMVTDRPGWTAANVASFQRLLGSTLERLEEHRATSVLRSVRPFAEAGRKASGAQLGLLLAWMSGRVLGQYDLLLTDDPGPEEDLVYFVGPNVVQLEEKHGFPAGEFRLWLAIHEVTHRAQFTAVPWLRDYFVSLVDEGLAPFAADPHQLAEGIRRAVADIRQGRNPMAEAGAVGLLATPEQLQVIRRVQALMSLLEGHGDVVMDRAGANLVPGAGRFSRVLAERRSQVSAPVRLLQQLLGLEAKLRQYAEGERFVRAVEEVGGRALFDEVWQGPEQLPSIEEIRDPPRWVARVRPSLPAAG